MFAWRHGCLIGVWLLSALLMHAADEAAQPKAYYRAPYSYGTIRDPDLPLYVRPASEVGWDLLKSAAWLDLGLDYRFRYEYRDDDIRLSKAGRYEPWLNRTRAYLGIREILDPFRFAIEMQDARRYNSDQPRDHRDTNEFELIRLYAELYFESALGVDDLGNSRPFSLRYGRLNFDFLDRRMLSNNQWRNTANAFQGFQAALGQEANDWQVDLLAVQPLERKLYEWDEPVAGQWLYAVIGHWRRWSDIITLEPYYLALHQSANGDVEAREIHSVSLRGYGGVEGSGFDYDFNMTGQFSRDGSRSHRAFAFTGELGYRWRSPWQPRASMFYGYVSGDRQPDDDRNQRFERFYGFSRPWSANDYIVYENISAAKSRLELKPHRRLRFDAGYSFYWLASASDRWANAGLRDSQGNSGRFLGHEWDMRARWQLSSRAGMTLGYASFSPGAFARNQGRSRDSDFAYVEFSLSLF